MDSAMSEVQELLAHAFIGQRHEQYLATALASWVLWDHLITLDQEIRLIWTPPRWTLIQILYLLIRYGITISYCLNLYDVFAQADTPNICSYSAAFMITFYVLSQFVQLVLCMRVWALYKRSYWIGAFLIAIYLGVVGTSLSTFIRYLLGAPAPIPPAAPGTPQIFGCVKVPIPGYYMGLVVAIALETIIVAMTIWKVLSHIRHGREAPLLNYLLSSGVAYYVVILVILLLDVLTYPIPVLEIPVLSSSCITVVQSVACCRIILGLLCYAKKHQEFISRSEIRTMETDSTSESSDFFTIPPGVYDGEDWEYILSAPPMDGLLEAKDDASVEAAPSSRSLTAVNTRSASQEA